MDRVINESVANKKKLEAIKSQRQKDGNELNVMKHIKDKALQVGIRDADYQYIQ